MLRCWCVYEEYWYLTYTVNGSVYCACSCTSRENLTAGYVPSDVNARCKFFLQGTLSHPTWCNTTPIIHQRLCVFDDRTCTQHLVCMARIRPTPHLTFWCTSQWHHTLATGEPFNKLTSLVVAVLVTDGPPLDVVSRGISIPRVSKFGSTLHV